MTKTLAQIVEEIEKAKTKDKQTALLIYHSSKALKDVLGYGMDPGVTWLLPQGDPPYKPLPEAAEQEGRLLAETRKFIYFVDSPDGRAIKPARREQLFIQLLESLDPRDAKLLLRIKNKTLKIKKEAVKAAFPNLAANW